MTGGTVHRPYVVTLGETMALMKAETPGPLAHVSSLSLGVGGWAGELGPQLAPQGPQVEVRAIGALGDEEREVPGGAGDPLGEPADELLRPRAHQLDQPQLRQRVRAAGFDVTQATVSRDIRELGLVKADPETTVFVRLEP